MKEDMLMFWVEEEVEVGGSDLRKEERAMEKRIEMAEMKTKTMEENEIVSRG